jgi:hypothetical protein
LAFAPAAGVAMIAAAAVVLPLAAAAGLLWRFCLAFRYRRENRELA